MKQLNPPIEERVGDVRIKVVTARTGRTSLQAQVEIWNGKLLHSDRVNLALKKDRERFARRAAEISSEADASAFQSALLDLLQKVQSTLDGKTDQGAGDSQQYEETSQDLCHSGNGTGTTPSLSAKELAAYVFDPQQEPPIETAYYVSFISQGDLTIWLGREKHRKTNLLLQFAISAATGRDFLHFRFAPAGPLRVVILDYETKTGSLFQRYQAIGKGMGLTDTEQQALRQSLSIIEARKLVREGRPLPRFPNRKRVDPSADEFWQQFRQQCPADIYIIDPMRSLHATDENDSAIEFLLSRMRQVFKDSAVVIAHHMRKQHVGGRLIKLHDDMRLWSDAARGSGAIKAHSDVIVCQERTIDDQGNEVVHVGAFLKDGPDVEPIALEETDDQSFYWKIRADVPRHLRSSYEALKATRRFSKKQAVEMLVQQGVKKPTAYRHCKELQRLSLLIEEADGSLSVNEPAKA